MFYSAFASSLYHWILWIFVGVFYICTPVHSMGLSTPGAGELDVKGDGVVNILVLGTSLSIDGRTSFAPDQIAFEIEQILKMDSSLDLDVYVAHEDIYRNKPVLIGLGGGGTEYTYTHHCHSLMQYYHWPENRAERLDNLAGQAGIAWDYVVIGADPHMVATMPGYYSLGVNKVAQKVTEGGAKALLLMMWPEEGMGSTVSHFEEITYRTSEGAVVDVPTIPAGLVWDDLPAHKKDMGSTNPSPGGAYVVAASIFAHLTGRSASDSEYAYDDEVADLAYETVIDAQNSFHFYGCRSHISPFVGCQISDSIINYNHTGTSSERGILGGLRWVFDKAPEVLQNGGTFPIEFNYGRANSNFEANKRYQIDTSRFQFSFGFPMQDHGNHGNNSMLYGLDRRSSGTMNDTDVGVARFMIERGELPWARAVPIRTLYAQMKDVIPGQSAYRDSWHMHRDLDKAIGAYMYTLLTGQCVLEEEPTDSTSAEWKSWMAHKIGYETAWNLMYLEGRAKGCEALSLTITAMPDIGGTVSGAGDYDYGQEVAIEAEPESGYTFRYWTLDGKELSTEAMDTFKMTDHTDLVAHFSIISDTQEDKDETVVVYPNPSTHVLNILGIRGEVKLVNIQGKVVWDGFVHQQHSIDVSQMAIGTYYLKSQGRVWKVLILR